MSSSIKITAITLITILISVSVLGCGWITQSVQAIDVDDAIDLEAAPHFRDVTFTIGTPEYSTAFDSLGKFKVTTGSPRLAINASNLVVTSPSNSTVRVTITEIDAPGINQTDRSTFQFKFMVGNVTTQYSNITLASVSNLTDHATVSFNNGTASIIVTKGSSTYQATLFSPVEADTYYILAFELSEDSVTTYLYDADGTLLANHLDADTDLVAGNLYSASMSVAGVANGYLKADYAYVSTDFSSLASYDELEMTALKATSSKSVATVQVDPTKLEMVRSNDALTSAIWGMDDIATNYADNDSAYLYSAVGSTAEPSQRVKGQFVAVGWDDFRADVETQLKAQIAKAVGVQANTIYLVDYYIDYLQVKTEMDQTIVDNQLSLYRKAMVDAAIAMGMDITGEEATSIASSIQSVPMYASGTRSFSFFSGTEFDILADILDCTHLGIINTFLQGTTDVAAATAEWLARTSAEMTLDPFGIKDLTSKLPSLEELDDYMDDKLNAMYNWTTGAVNAGISSVQEWCNQTYIQLYSYFSTETERWNAVLNATMEQYAALTEDTVSALTGFFDATINELTTEYGDLNDKIANMNAEYMNWTNQMMIQNNAMFSQLIWDLSQGAQESERYFIDQLAASNEAVANVSDQLALSTESTSEMFASLLDSGKLASGEGFSFGALLSEGSISYNVVIVIVLMVIAATAIFFLMTGGKRRRTVRKRQ